MTDTNITNIYSGDNKPSHAVRWLLLIAAILIVVILLTMLISGRFRDKTPVVPVDDTPIELNLESAGDIGDIMQTAEVNWGETVIGETKDAVVKIFATASTNVRVDVSRVVAGFNVNQTCNEIGKIDSAIPCRVALSYTPNAVMSATAVQMNIRWWGDKEIEDMARSRTITIILGAVEPRPEPQPTIIETPSSDYNSPEYDEPFAEPVKRAVHDIAPSDPFADAAPAPIPEIPNIKDTKQSCSEFAFPGYNSYGTQIGWIKPYRGAYYFHPFSDRDCTNATGMYNPDNGIITDINNPGRRIGTDAEHIGYIASGASIPQLSNPTKRGIAGRAKQLTDEELGLTDEIGTTVNGGGRVSLKQKSDDFIEYGSTGESVISTNPYDRTFVLRQYKPIPATIVSDVRADSATIKGENRLPVRATVDRNVYSDNGRTVVIPAGTLLLGYLTGDLPGPYKAIGRMNINWYQFILPSGVEFNFAGNDEDPFSGDAQGRVGVPGHGSTDYIEQIVMPMLTAIVPAAVNMIAPIADTFVNKIDLDNNTVTQSGTVRSSELAKNQIVNAWNQVAQKLLVDAMDNTVPPFTIAAGTRITVYSPKDLIITCGDDASKKCAIQYYGKPNNTRAKWKHSAKPDYDDGSWEGQVRSFMISDYCNYDSNGNVTVEASKVAADGYDYRTVLFYCQSQQYQAKNNAKQAALYQNQQDVNNKNSIASKSAAGTQTYNEQVLGLKYTSEGEIKNPFKKEAAPAAAPAPTISCLDGTNPDANGCCTGEIYTDMGDMGFNCCPETGGDCFPPITQ